MYEFLYHEMEPRYPTAKMIFTDTDSLTYLVQTNGIYKDVVENMIHGNQLYDMSDYQDDHPCFKDLHAERVKSIQ